MAVQQKAESLATDAAEAAKLLGQLAWRRILTVWVYVPCGLCFILAACYGVSCLIGLSTVSFPASVACMLVLFLSLIAGDYVVGEKRVRAFVGIVQIPAGFALRYINLFFVPSFVVLPLSPPISGAEVGKIIAVFLGGFLVMMTCTAYLVRFLQAILGSQKRALIERAEEMGNESDEIPLSAIQPTNSAEVVTVASTVMTEGRSSGESTPDRADEKSLSDDEPTRSSLQSPMDVEEISVPQRSQGPNRGRMEMDPADQTMKEPASMRMAEQTPPPLTRPQQWATFLNQHLDRLTWAVLFIFVGIPVYYAAGYAMPIQLALSVMVFQAAMSLPVGLRQKILHPVLVTSAFCIPLVIVLGLIHGYSWRESLQSYRPGSTYLKLWANPSLPAPGAGDIFISLLDCSIVAFALPMYQYRKELQRNFFTIIIPNVSLSIASLFGYPPLCYAIGISATRSLSFSCRSLTLALATPAVTALGGDLNELAPLTIGSGILGVLIGNRMLAWLKIPEDDYVTRGITLGGNSSAIVTALLLGTDPRAAALSSLSMSLFGAITIAMTAIPPIVTIIRSLVGL